MKKDFKIAIVGLGYVGLPLLCLISKKKIKASGFDIDEKKIKKLKKNISYISDVNPKDLRLLNKKDLYSLKNISKIKHCNYIIFCLPTPLTKNNAPDVSIINKSFDKLKNHLVEGQTIILESTVYPGATKKIFHDFLEKRFDLGKNFFYGYSSERISPGQTDKKVYKIHYQNITKVISGYDNNSVNKIFKFYSKIFKKIFIAKNIEVAEMSKLLENSYRAVNIGLVNELKVVCEKVGLDINAVIDAASTKPFGYNAFRPGPGVGGHCIPIDPVFISWVAKKNNYRARFIELARRTNLNITQWTINKIINLIKKRFNSLKIRILVIGVSYKPDVNDIRESPSVNIFLNLLKKTNKVDYYDPYIPFFEKASKNYYSINNLSRINKYDLVLILTDHSNLNYKHILMQSKLIVDTRGVYKKIQSEKIFNF